MIKIKKYQIEDYISDATQDALDLKADLVDGKVPASQLPSFVDDVIEVANYATLPIPGSSGVIYITLDTNKVYRWSGSVYVEIASGVTNLSYTPGVSNGTVNSDTGSDATIPLAGTVNAGLFSAAEKSKLEGIAPNANVGVIPNAPITGATKTKITYDSKGLVTSGDDANTADIADSINKRYVTDANLTVINNTSGTNTGDQNLQEVTTLGATTTNPITITVGNGGANGLSSFSSQGYGIRGESSETIAVYGTSISTGVYGEGNTGVYAYSAGGTGIEVYGNGSVGISVNLGNSNKGLVINSGTSSTGNPIEIVKSDDVKFTINQQGEQSIVKIPGGLSTEYLMADGTTTTGGGGDFVPYTGATSNVNLGEFGIQLGNLEFDNTPTNIPTTAGSMYYNDADGTLDLILKGGNVKLQIGQETVIRVVNKTATNISLLESNYQAVRITGAQGQRPKVDLAQATNDGLSAETIGLVTETIANNQEGFITTSGLVRGINTTGSLQGETWLDGDILYLSPTIAGSVTKVKPEAPNHLIIIGYVISAHITQGTIFVKVDNGYELNELHNVKINGVANNNVLAYTSSTSIWENKTIATALGYTPANDASVVHLTGNETIAGLKTFTDNLTAGRYLYSGGSIFPEFGQTFYINGTGATHYFGGGTSNAQNNLDVPNGTLKIGLQTASTIASFDANKNVVSLTTANGYPTLTELKSLVGVSTTAIQTQLNSKQTSSSILSGLSALSFSGGTPFVRMVSASVFILDTSTYLTSVGIANLTATGTPSATTYLRGDNTWSSIPVPSQGAYTVLANNTNASAVPTEQVYKDVGQQTYTATPTWSTSAPTTILANTYEWTQIGSTVNVRISLSYNTGAVNSSVILPMPADMPVPASITGFTGNSDIIAYGSGMMLNATTSTAVTGARNCLLRRNTSGGYEFFVNVSVTVTTKVVIVNLTYFA